MLPSSANMAGAKAVMTKAHDTAVKILKDNGLNAD